MKQSYARIRPRENGFALGFRPEPHKSPWSL